MLLCRPISSPPFALLLSIIALFGVASLFTSCSLTLDLSACDSDSDCEEGWRCTEDQLCERDDSWCDKDRDCPDGYLCEDHICVEDDDHCTRDDDCPTGYLCAHSTCVEDEGWCDDDSPCDDGYYCDDHTCVEKEEPCPELGGNLELMWSDFEDEEFTNVEGFREPRDNGTDAFDFAPSSLPDSAAVELSYHTDAEEPDTGYKLYAYPDADISDFDHLTLRARAETATTGVRVELWDTDNVSDASEPGAVATIDLGTQWRNYELPIDDFEYADDEARIDFEHLQLITIAFDNEITTPAEGTVFVERVGFFERPSFEELDVVWSDFDTEEMTNQEGFREPINDRTAASDQEDIGIDGSTVLRLQADLSGAEPNATTGYDLFAYPHADMDGHTHFAMRVRSPDEVVNLFVNFVDTEELTGDGGGTETISTRIDAQWHWVVFPLDALAANDDESDDDNGADDEDSDDAQEREEMLPDMSVLQLISLTLEAGTTCPDTATIYVDKMGFIDADGL